jgi:hypothetical protein
MSVITIKERISKTPPAAVTEMAARHLPVTGEVTCNRAPDQHPVVLAVEKLTSFFKVLTKGVVSFLLASSGHSQQQV